MHVSKCMLKMLLQKCKLKAQHVFKLTSFAPLQTFLGGNCNGPGASRTSVNEPDEHDKIAAIVYVHAEVTRELLFADWAQ